jgi:hypothetical protein
MIENQEVGHLKECLNNLLIQRKNNKRYSLTYNESYVIFVQKWSDLAVDVFQGLIKIEEKLRDDLNVIVIGHTERNTDVNGNSIITLQTVGKLLDNQIKIPSYFTYVLHTDVKEVNGKMEYSLLTNSDGLRLAKSPEGCLEKFEPNDYALILDKINKYQLGE